MKITQKCEAGCVAISASEAERCKYTPPEFQPALSNQAIYELFLLACAAAIADYQRLIVSEAAVGFLHYSSNYLLEQRQFLPFHIFRFQQRGKVLLLPWCRWCKNAAQPPARPSLFTNLGIFQRKEPSKE